MIESIEFKNFKALRDTTLPLGPCTILVGPNGSGKSTVLQALELFPDPEGELLFSKIISFGTKSSSGAMVQVKFTWTNGSAWMCYWEMGRRPELITKPPQSVPSPGNKFKENDSKCRIRVYSLDAEKIAAMAPVQKGVIELASDGTGLAAVLDAMRDEATEQFKAIESQIGEWLPEFDRILFDRPKEGCKSIALRTREGQHKVPATDLSQGTLISLALLTLAYHPTPPSLIALEEPDRGIHPYLLRHVKDVLIRLGHPESCGEEREPVQVIATTHSPYFIDLFRETPEDVVVANKIGLDVQFQRLINQPDFQDILGEAALGDAWYSGVLGGVPSGS